MEKNTGKKERLQIEYSQQQYQRLEGLKTALDYATLTAVIRKGNALVEWLADYQRMHPDAIVRLYPDMESAQADQSIPLSVLLDTHK